MKLNIVRWHIVLKRELRAIDQAYRLLSVFGKSMDSPLRPKTEKRVWTLQRHRDSDRRLVGIAQENRCVFHAVPAELVLAEPAVPDQVHLISARLRDPLVSPRELPPVGLLAEDRSEERRVGIE